MTEAIDMCKHLTVATVRGDVNAQYHWANLIMLEALARGAKGPEDMGAQLGAAGQLAGSTPVASINNFEDASEEARR